MMGPILADTVRYLFILLSSVQLSSFRVPSICVTPTTMGSSTASASRRPPNLSAQSSPFHICHTGPAVCV